MVSVSVPSVGTSLLSHQQNALLRTVEVEEILNFPSLAKLDLNPALCNACSYHTCVFSLRSSIPYIQQCAVDADISTCVFCLHSSIPIITFNYTVTDQA